MNDVVSVLAAAFIMQIAGAIVLIAVLKNDSKWIKEILVDHENRIRHREQGKRGVVELESLGI